MNTEPMRRTRDEAEGPHKPQAMRPRGGDAPRTERVRTVTQLLAENQRLKLEVDRLRAEALTDALTGLANRRNLDERLGAELSRAKRYGQSLAVMCVDVDDFKRINDTWGHAKGDEVLVWVGRFLRSQIRAHDIAGRVGGDEFVVVLPATDAKGAATLADRLRKALLELTGSSSHPVSLSIGVAALEPGAPESTSGDDLLHAADEDMYRHKAMRRPRRRT